MDFLAMKEAGEKITMLTAYDYPSAKLAEAAGVDLLLVGDSVGMVMLGYASTVEVTIDDMVHHAKAARRGATDTFIVVDMPFMSYHISLETSLTHALRLFQTTGAQALKVEGASTEVCQLITRLTSAGIPVVAHLGLTPQAVNVLGGFKVQGKTEAGAKQLIEEAKKVEKSGAILCVLEGIPEPLARFVADHLKIPTIGIGASQACDGQVLVYHDLLQYGSARLPKFVKTYADLNETVLQALKQYVKEVKTGQFPALKHTYSSQEQQILRWEDEDGNH